MGGILGLYHKDAHFRIAEEVPEKLAYQIRHRGNDQVIFQPACNVALGSIYDKNLEQNNHASAHDERRNIYVLLDGFIILKEKGRSKWHGNKRGDAELILSLYGEKGIGFMDEVDGSYAIGIWDGNRKEVVLIRDRLGYKPIFYAKAPDTFVFASEIKAVLASPFYQKGVDLKGIDSFLSYGYSPNPGTLFEGIFQVKPGHALTYASGNILEKAYWKFKYGQDGRPKEEKYYFDEFSRIFENSVARRIARYPDAGAFLSGGLDTSGVVAILHNLNHKPVKVFTAGFKEERYDETEDAKIVSNFLHLDQYTVTVGFDDYFTSLLEKIVWHHDGPFADTSAIPSYYAAKLAKEHVDTVLTGDFPDQLIGGSGHHVMALRRLREDHFFYHFLKNKGLNKAVRRLNWSAGGTSVLDKAKRAIYRETFPLEEQRIILGMPVPPLLKRCLYSPELLQISEKYDALNIAQSIYSEVKEEDLLNRLLYFDILSYAADDLMVKVERMTMAHGLNAISPFHDRELVEFIASVPSHLKINGTTRKYIMREALRPLLPEHTLNKEKQGFAMPIGEWLVTKMPDYVRNVLLDSKTLNRGYFNKKFITKMVGNFLTGRTDYASGNEATIISLITLELWHRIFIDH
jgi:asparagine synthase (glutamine-hydrolysing)